ncbi:MAG: phage terminase large subunit [Pseudomonadota bacterium]
MHLDLSLHYRQGLAFRSKATEILYGGAAGGGKSHLMRASAIISSAAVPGLQTYLFRRNYDELISNHMEGPSGFPNMLAPWENAGLCSIIRSSPPEIRFWNGSKIYLRHCQHEDSVYKYQGTEIHQLLIDELTHWKAPMYRYLRGRCRVAGLDIPVQYKGQFPRILCGGNPGGIGHNWVKSFWINGADAMEIRKMSASEAGMLRQYIPAKLADNPSLLAGDPEYASRLMSLGDPALVRAMLEGDWDIVAGGMFDDIWRRDVHVIEPFDIPKGWKIDRSFDWGSAKPYSVGYWAEADGTQPQGFDRHIPKGTLFRIGEIYGAKGENEGVRHTNVEIAKTIKAFEKSKGWNVKPGPADSAIYDDSGGSSIAGDMEKEGVRFTPSQKGPGSRKQGWQQLRKRLKAATEPVMEEPGLLVFNTCKEFIRTVPVLPRDERDPEDVDTDAEDHIGDETRYRLTKVKRTVSTGKVSGI